MDRSSEKPFSSLDELMAFRAPYLEEKLVKDRVVATAEDAHALFQEAKKYLVLASIDRSLAIPMFSRRVDEAWHQLVLYTAPYAAFCDRFFGRFLDHFPNEAPASEKRTPISFEQFTSLYEGVFGEISPLWHDDRHLGPRTRVLGVRYRRPLGVRIEGHAAQVVIERDPPFVLLETERHAADALRFAIARPSFYVRELPGLDADDRLALCRGLVAANVVRFAA